MDQIKSVLLKHSHFNIAQPDRRLLEHKVKHAGFYVVSTESHHMMENGGIVEYKNSARKWYTPWRPKTFKLKDYYTYSLLDGKKYELLKAGSVVRSTFKPVRL